MTPDAAELLGLATMCSTQAHLALADRPRRLDDAAAWTEAAAELMRQYDELPDRARP